MSARMLILAAALLVADGCAAWRPGPTLPMNFAVVRDELILHSDFDVPPHHWLLDELVALRASLCRDTALPTPSVPVHIYLFHEPRRFQAFIDELHPEFPTRRAFFVEEGPELAVYAHWGPKAAEDLRHEVTHGYLHAVVPPIPLWLDEGLAEHFETAPEAQGLNRPHALLLQAAVDGGWYPDLRRLAAVDSPAALTQRHYAEAWLWVHFLLTEEDRRAVLTEYLAQWARHDDPTPLPDAILDRWPDAADRLVDHLRGLAPAGAGTSSVPHPGT